MSRRGGQAGESPYRVEEVKALKRASNRKEADALLRRIANEVSLSR